MAVALQRFDDTALIRFPDWAVALQQADLSFALRAAHRIEIVRFLRFCKAQHAGATIRLIRHYLDRERRSPAAREALRWFFRAAKSSSASRECRSEGTPRASEPTANLTGSCRIEVPPVAQHDLGGADWERDLIKAVRERGFLWRTEETYRMWSARFARFLQPRSPYVATAVDVGHFLSGLAVQQRAMPSTQK